MARDQGHSDPETIYDTMLPQGVPTNQILDSYVNLAASKQNLSSGFPTKWYSNQPAKLQRPARKLKWYVFYYHLQGLSVNYETIFKSELF